MKFVFFLKSILFKKTLGAYISKSKQCYNGKPSTYYLYARTKIPVDFHNFISVRLMETDYNHGLLNTLYLVSHRNIFSRPCYNIFIFPGLLILSTGTISSLSVMSVFGHFLFI